MSISAVVGGVTPYPPATLPNAWPGVPASNAASQVTWNYQPDRHAIPTYLRPAQPLPTRLHVGTLPTGPLDGITDVPGVLVGHVTRIEGDDVRDGATVVMPNADPWIYNVAAATYTINGNGAMTNRDFVDEFGFSQTPIVLVGNTLGIGRAYDGVIDALIAKHPGIAHGEEGVPLPIVCEIDGEFLNNAQKRVISASEIAQMILSARGGQFARGSVGAGTPSRAFQYKAGVGSSSRVLPPEVGGYTVGVLVNANMDIRSHLKMAGLPVGDFLPKYDLPQSDNRYHNHGQGADGSIIIVVATNAPLTPLQLKAMAERTAAGLYRSGSNSRISSGDQVIAFSTSRVTRFDPKTGTLTPSNVPEITDENTLNALYAATADSTESAIDNSLLASANHQYRGNGMLISGIPVAALLWILAHPPTSQLSGTSISAPA
jgi:D-aminopeptidase